MDEADWQTRRINWIGIDALLTKKDIYPYRTPSRCDCGVKDVGMVFDSQDGLGIQTNALSDCTVQLVD